ncbi:MAG: Calx-beta domain-containing protein, partial [Chloroflexota bacterium]
MSSGQLTISSNLDIVGNGAANTIVDGQKGTASNTRVFNVTAGTASISGLTIRNGETSLEAGIAVAVRHHADRHQQHHQRQLGLPLAPAAAVVASSSPAARSPSPAAPSAATRPAVAATAAVVASSSPRGTVTVTNSTLSGNPAFAGGGIFVAGGTATVTNSTLSGNSGNGDGGGGILVNGGTATVTNSALSGNSAPSASGGGIFVTGGTVTVTNSTLSGNSAGTGGGIRVAFGSATVTHSTLRGNSATTAVGGGVGLSGGTLSLRATIIAAGSSGGNCSGTITSLGSNLSSDNSCAAAFTQAGDANNVATLNLGPLANNGGPTQTHALLSGSTAIDAVQGSCTSNGTSGGTTITTDQRGTTRPIDGNGDTTATCDVGAFEASPGTLQFSNPTFTIGEAGPSATITISRTGGSDLTVGATVSLGGGSSTATPGNDYTATPLLVSFSPGETSKNVSVPILQDPLDEDDETVLLTLGSPTGGAAIGAQSTATLTITDDDPTPTLSVGNVTVPEGNAGSTNGVFQITLSAASGRTVTVQAQTANGIGVSGAVAGSDYTAVAQTVTFTPGQTVQTVSVPVLGDVVDEVDETFSLNLSAPTNASIAVGTGTGTITDDDTSSIAVDDVSVAEGNAGSTNATFTVSLSTPNSRTVTVQAQTANGAGATGAVAGSDYTAVNVTVTFNAGETSKPVVVPVLGDTADEPNETFAVNLASPVNAVIGDAQGIGTILDDDGPPVLSIVDRAGPEGNAGASNLVFTVTLLPASGQTVTVVAQTANGTGANGAVAGQDYTAVGPTTLTFNPGVTSQTVAVSILGDVLGEADETFVVSLSSPTNATIATAQAVGTIQNDDVPALSVNDVSVVEGSAGSTAATFTVSLSQPSALTVTVQVQTANGTATAGSDYTAAGQTVTFTPGETSKPFVVAILGDTIDEPNET